MRKKQIQANSSLVRLCIGIGLSAVVLVVPNRIQAACGPGSHWVTTCAAGTNSINLQATISTDLIATPIVLSGSMTVLRGSPSASDPSNPNHLDRIPAEVVSLSLTGTGSESGLTISGGDGVGNLARDSSTYSPASITESPSDATQATIVIDIFIEFKSALLGINLRNEAPIHIQANIDRFPLAFNSTVTGPIPLLNSSGQKALQINSVTFAATLAAPVIPPNSIVNNASYTLSSLPVAPGSIAAIFGSNLTDGGTCVHAAGCDQTFDANGVLKTTMTGAQVTVNGTPVPIFYSTSGQLGIQIPPDLAVASATVQVTVGGQTSAPATVALTQYAPGIFSVNNQGTGQGAVKISNTAIFAAPEGSIPGEQARPARRGEFITIFCTGLGDVNPRPTLGKPGSADPNSLSRTLSTPQVTIGGAAANVVFSGLSPGNVGLYQVDAQIPDGAPSGSAIDVVLSIGGVASNRITIAVQ
ncbi:MAG: hypothetical protein HYX72_08040 [Acidobacteria bacterium]|nr:hypothetical protein [Acidobacteriota bacterium]